MKTAFCTGKELKWLHYIHLTHKIHFSVCRCPCLMGCHGPFYYFCIILNMVLNRCLEAFYYAYLHQCAYSCMCVSVYLCVYVYQCLWYIKKGCAFPCQDCMKGLQHLGLEIVIRENIKFMEKNRFSQYASDQN